MKRSKLGELGLSKAAFKQLFSRMWQFVHPMFKISNNVVLNVSLESVEIEITGFLWDVFPLPKEKLFIKISKNSDKVIIFYEMYKSTQ